MAINDALLIQIYNNQAKTPEKLAGTRDLMVIGDTYRGAIASVSPKYNGGELFTNEQLLARLLDLRKGGKLPRKSDRVLGKPKPQVWPNLSELQELDGKPYYRIAIEVDVTIEHLVALLYDALKNGERDPLSRAEVYVLLQRRIPNVLDRRNDQEYLDAAWAIVRRLFPELEG